MLLPPRGDGSQYRLETLAFLRKEIFIALRIFLVSPPADEVGDFQFFKPVRQDIGSDFFRGGDQFLVTPLAQYQVANDQQRPPVAKNIQRVRDGTA